MTDDWPERIAQAQRQTHTMIDTKTYARTPYGKDYPQGKPRCRDCAVEFGQLHVPTCCVERCPACGGQAIGCECPDAIALVPQ